MDILVSGACVPSGRAHGQGSGATTPKTESFSLYVVAEWYGAGLCDREVTGSTPARGCCVPTPTQRAIPPGSVNE